MNINQKAALVQLHLALKACTDSALFDDLSGAELHPDQINKFCDGVDEAVAAHNLELAVGLFSEGADGALDQVNTEILYTYRDANNYKSSRTVVLEGTPSLADMIELLDACDKNNGDRDIIPGLVGLDDLQIELTGGFNEEVDTPFHELEGVSLTVAAADTGLPSFASFKAMVLEQGGKDGSNWNEDYRPGDSPAAPSQRG